MDSVAGNLHHFSVTVEGIIASGGTQSSEDPEKQSVVQC